jgi:hypothetical protein
MPTPLPLAPFTPGEEDHPPTHMLRMMLVVASNDDDVSSPYCGLPLASPHHAHLTASCPPHIVSSPSCPSHCVLPASSPPHRVLLTVSLPPSRPPRDHCVLLTAPSAWCPTPTLILISILHVMPA